MPSITCTRCGAGFQPPHPDTNVFGPAQKQSVLSLDPFLCSCPGCGERTIFQFPCVYHEAHFAVRLRIRNKPDVFWEPEDPWMCLRDTSDLMVFREKVLLLSAGYDDRIVEMVKLLSQSSNEDLKLTDIIAVDVSDDAIVFSAGTPDGGDFCFGSPRGLYENVRAELPASLLHTEGFTCVDVRWAAARVRPRAGRDAD